MKTALVNGKIYVERGVFKSAAAMENGIITAVGSVRKRRESWQHTGAQNGEYDFLGESDDDTSGICGLGTENTV